MRKFFLTVIFIFIALFFLKNVTFAQENDISKNFDITANVSYQVGETGNTKISQNISITNKEDFIYIPTYSISISNKGISDVSVTNGEGKVPFTEKDENGKKQIILSFSDRTVGKGKKNNFTISYHSSAIAEKTGNVWRVYIPAVAKNNSFSAYTATVDVPRSFGPVQIVKPQIPVSEGVTHFVFDQADLNNSGISLVFGESQNYNFNLSYNLENKNLVPIRTEIALPPNTAYQEVFINSLAPLPENVYEDEDGNFLATYLIPAKSKLTVKANVSVTSFPTPVLGEAVAVDVSKYLQPQKYWDSTNPQIKELAKTYNTPKKIYDYVVKTLNYSKEKSTGGNKRIGAANVLKNPSFAVCLEFTDLFIALSRAAGIPARAVEGYAYTSDENDQPVSLFEDVLHSWPEYYDSNQKKWIMVDPTWGNTTRGVDYFNTFDFDHVAFAINGLNSEYPVPAGGYKSDKVTKDVTVSFEERKEMPEISYIVTAHFPSIVFSNSAQGEIILTNTSGQEIKKLDFRVLMGGIEISTVTFSQVPPFGTKTVSVDLNPDIDVFNLQNIKQDIKITDTVRKTVFEKEIYVLPVSYWYLIGGGIFCATVTIFIIALKTGGLHLQRQKS